MTMAISIESFASSSAGNCYRISDGKNPLLIEAGITSSKIKKALNFELSVVSGCLVSHEHGDHAKAVNDLLRFGVDCLMSIGTAQAIGCLNHRRCYTCKATVKIDFAGWAVLPFSTVHDCAEPLGFLLKSKSTGEKLLFATDTAYIRNRFAGLNYIMVECNYDDETMQENIRSGALTFAQYERVMRTHFGLERVVEFLRANDLSQLREIHLLHLSNGNANEERIKTTIQRVTGVPVCVA